MQNSIINESHSDYKIAIKLSGKWIGDIENIVETARLVYLSNPSVTNYTKLKIIVDTAKTDIVDMLNLPFMSDSDDKIMKRIVNQYTEYYLKLIQNKY